MWDELEGRRSREGSRMQHLNPEPQLTTKLNREYSETKNRISKPQTLNSKTTKPEALNPKLWTLNS